jgi:hypothetical protein
MNKSDMRNKVKERLDGAIKKLNSVLTGKDISQLETVLSRLGRGQELPHWYKQLKSKHCLPNLDGKTIGSVIEMLFVGVLEKFTLADIRGISFGINPARGVDIPDLDLGIKSPSENFCTSEPFFSAYERLLGNEHDIVVLLTDYQTAKKKPPLRVSIIKYEYLTGSEVADKNLCSIALKHRQSLLQINESLAKKVFKFLAYINQSDWRAKRLLTLIDKMFDDTAAKAEIEAARADFAERNEKLLRDDREPLFESEMSQITDILKVKPLHIGIIEAADNWVIETHKDFGRIPNDNEWERLKRGPLNGRIGMSFALQWRYNFGPLFRNSDETEEEC